MIRLFFILLCFALPQQLWAENARFSLAIKGVNAGTLTWQNTAKNTDQYALSAEVRTKGLLSVFKKVQYSLQATGQISPKGQFMPHYYLEKGENNGIQKQYEVRWQKGIPATRYIGPEQKDRPFVDPAKQKGAVDPLVALYGVLRDQKPGQECGKKYSLYNGRSKSELVFTEIDRQEQITTCKGQYRRLAGYSAAELAKAPSFAFTITYQRTDQGMMRVQSIKTDTQYGSASLQRIE